MRKRGRRAQITPFIIIAIILLFSSALIFYMRAKVTSYQPPARTAEDVPHEVRPVKIYVENCMNEVAKDALKIMGQQGGYINLENFHPITSRILPAEGDMLSLGNNQYIPFWFFNNNLEFDEIAIPKVHMEYRGDLSMEDQLNDYVEENIEFCLNNFEEFEVQNMGVSPVGEIEVTTTVTDETVDFFAEFPLEVATADAETTVKEYFTSLPVRLGTVAQLAEDITLHEADSVFLERNTLNLIGYYSDLDNRMLPPLTAVDFSTCDNRVHWISMDVEQNMKEMLADNIGYLRFDKTNFHRIEITPTIEPDAQNRAHRQAIFDNMIIDASEESYPQMRVDVLYDETYPLMLDFGKQGLLGPSAMEMNLIFIQRCMFDYKFFYSMQYPLLFMVTDPESELDNEPYVFQFALEVVLKDNFPRVSVGDVTQYTIEEDIPSYACREEQATSGDIKLNFVDRLIGWPLDKVYATYQCGPSMVYKYDENGTLINATPFSDVCNVGSSGPTGEINTRLSLCHGVGLVTAEREGFLTKWELLGDVLPNQDIDRTINMTPLITKNINVEKLFVKPPADGFVENPGVVLDSSGNVIECNAETDPKPMKYYEEAYITIEKLDFETGIYNGVPFTIYNPENVSTLDLAPGRYLVEITMIRREQFAGDMTIQANSQSITIDKGPFQGSETVYYPDDDVLVPQTISGGSMVIWEISDDIYQDENVTFYVFDEGKPQRLEEIGQPQNHVEGCSSLNQNLLQPQY